MNEGDVFVLKSNNNIGIKIGAKVQGNRRDIRKIQHVDLNGKRVILSPIFERANEVKILKMYDLRIRHDIKRFRYFRKDKKKKVESL